MTRIDLYTAHSSALPAAEGPGGHYGDRQDFLDHLREREQGGRPNADRPASDGESPRQPAADLDNSPSQPGGPFKAPGRYVGRAPTDAAAGGGADALWEGNTPLQATRSATITADESVTLARVFEQHGFANGYLSFIANASNERPAREHDGTVAARTGHAFAAMAEPAATSATVAAGVVLPEGAAPWPVVVDGPGNTIDTATRSVERMVRALGPLVAADKPWPERLLRLSMGPGGKAALWVRDYALSPQAIEPLVANLRQLAGKEGVALARVVVNGTTVWRSESSKGEA